MSGWTQEQLNETVEAVLAKAGSDAAFRALAISDIYAAIKAETGHEVPQEFKINIVDATGYHTTIVLPEVRGAEDELTETELESVAGGSKEGFEEFGRRLSTMPTR
ncbi:nitrile hydratase [Paenibacillus sp. PCH8]|uniref:NHLP leader peptide family RiPP precursor n=1 Tax=Paenibacillus sp. PCH8 TaxID=2066524 RepID=UPI000CF840B7|nr:NHLP leader peptide family RiPP precursor [Paenibacillus sp. PCH8]PQP84166.1 nitrile hydratase [Paenibacillus sp. PCH8]